MSWIERLRARLRPMLMRSASESRMDEEMRHHLEMETEKNLREGMEPGEARRRALAVFGGVDGHKDQMRSDRSFGAAEDFARDVRYAWRSLLRAPAFAVAAVLTIGLGIGANTAIFGVVDAMFMQAPAGVRDAGEVVRLYFARDEGMIQNPGGGAGSYVDYRVIGEEVPGFSETAAFFGVSDLDLGRGAEAQRLRGSVVSRTFFPLLGVDAEVGRIFLPEEDSVPGEAPVAVISHDLWRRQFGADPAAVGQTMVLNSQTVTIVGVMQEGFTGIEPDPVDVWIPMAMSTPLGLMSGDDWRQNPFMIRVSVLGRLASGADLETTRAAAEAALRRSAEAAPEIDPTPVVLTGTLVPAGGPTRSPAADLAVWLLMVTGLVLVIACANVANLLLSRSASRRRETAIRFSVGATRSRVIRQRLTETLVIATLGAVVGVVIALWSTRLIGQFPLPPSATELSVRPLLFALALVLATTLLVGVLPALQASRSDPVVGLRDGRTGMNPRGMRVRRVLIATQVALSLVLLVGAGLFLRSLREVYAVDPGVDVDRLLLVSADLRKAGYDDPDREAFYRDARERVLRIPGVEAAAMAHFAPFARMSYGIGIAFPDHPEVSVQPSVDWVSPGYFSTVGTGVLQGRPIGPGDGTGEPVAVVNESLARLLASGPDPLGACLEIDGQPGCTRVVGVAGNQRTQLLESDVKPFVYLPRDRDPTSVQWGGPNLVVRTRGEAADLAGEVRSTLQGLDPRLPFVAVEALSSIVRPELLPYRLGAILFTLFGVLALVLAAVGLYGVLGYFIAERRPEIGIRRSLGAGEAQVIRLVLSEGIGPVAVGLVGGLLAALTGARVVEALLFGVEARDPLSFGAAAAFLFAVALVASYLPARRAARVDPMEALRAE